MGEYVQGDDYDSYRHSYEQLMNYFPIKHVCCS